MIETLFDKYVQCSNEYLELKFAEGDLNQARKNLNEAANNLCGYAIDHNFNLTEFKQLAVKFVATNVHRRTKHDLVAVSIAFDVQHQIAIRNLREFFGI